ncbi:hypothetical protein HMPREF9370_1706 [Neisseria wadsworthii 9715]|uniref:Uncharacterized protein n=1 Tax=Neisseria wadsworthii 9715 TaxID=1030841 RepID=G4CRJ6_9NEIS|nr:hypothetical protein HMPREF9370_1706 [Neisseria wadsworthii 9715]
MKNACLKTTFSDRHDHYSNFYRHTQAWPAYSLNSKSIHEQEKIAAYTVTVF